MKTCFVLALALICSWGCFAQKNDTVVTVALTGDIMKGTTYPKVQLPPHEGRQLFVDALPVL